MSQLRRRTAGSPAAPGGEVGELPRIDAAGLQAARLTLKNLHVDLVHAEILSLLSQRDKSASACPSEIARKLANGDEWRALMPKIRQVLGDLSDAGKVLVTRGTEVLNASDFGRGPIRFRRGRLYDEWLVSHGHDD